MLDPRRIRIVQPGWETYTGPFGSITFDQGVSTHLVDPVSIDRIAAEMHVIDADSKDKLGAQERMIHIKTQRLDAIDRLDRVPEGVVVDPVVKVEKIEPTLGEKIWTVNDLEAVADDTGIRGLREIGDPMGAKGRAIPELIGNILRVQDELRSAAAARLKREG
jgi:hypothetical protein